MNALIFLVPEDIVDVRPRLVCTFLRTPVRCVLTSAYSHQILTFVGSLMSVAQQ